MALFYEMKRSELPDDVFGIPQERKYPMPDKKHTESAIRLFNHVEEKYEKQLAEKIIENMKKYDIDPSMIGEKNRLRKYLPKDMLDESCVMEETIIDQDKLPKFIYHISDTNHDGEVFKPRVYDNDNVKKGMERRVKRVCFSDSITRALYSIFPNGAYDADFYVHIPDSDCKVYKTTTDDIYDSDITHELWIKEPVKMKCIGKIHISAVSNKTHTIDVDKNKSGYGKKKYNETKWKWVEKYEQDKSLYEATNEQNMVDETLVNEETLYTKKNKYPVYIIAMHSGTLLANIIKNVTKDEFSHVCISFNSSLDPMYSFGSKKLGGKELGLTKQSPTDDFYQHYKAHYKVYVTFVDKESIDKMKTRLKWFEDNDEKLSYDIFGLVEKLFNKDTESHTYKYFCSRFVAELLGKGGLGLDKVPSLYTPQDLVGLDFISLVNAGEDFFKYNVKNTEKNLKNIKKQIYDKLVFSESFEDKMELYSAYHLEPQYKDPKYCCWDEELYYKDLISAVRALHSNEKEEGEYEVYTDLGCGKTKYIGQITYYIKPDTDEPSYTWNKYVRETAYLLEDNAANTAIVGTAGNVFIHNCMKKNTFVETPEDNENEYIVSRDGGTDIFRFDGEGNKYKLTREEFISNYIIKDTYKFNKPLIQPIDYYRNVLESSSGYDFYLHLINNEAPQEDISKDPRFESTVSFFDELDSIRQKIFCEYYKIRPNKSVIDWVDENIQSLSETPYRPDSEKSVNETGLMSNSDYIERMVSRLKTLKECLPSIH